MPLLIQRADITRMRVDAIVNAANTRLEQGGGVCGAIYAAAGAEQLAQATRPLGPIQPGEAVITPGFDLPAKYIIHTPGPIWQGGHLGEAQTLRASYQNSLRRAVETGLHSIAFPLISSGIYGYPPEQALSVARAAILDFLDNSALDLTVYLLVFDRAAFAASQALMRQVDSYIDQHYVDAHQRTISSRGRPRVDDLPFPEMDSQPMPRQKLWERLPRIQTDRPARKKAPEEELTRTRLDAPGQVGDAGPLAEAVRPDLADYLRTLDEPFSDTLMRLIDQKGLTDPQVYKKANLDRRLFSKIRSNPQYRPRKTTALALCIALGLDMADTRDLLARAGFALSSASRFDLIVSYFIDSGQYDIFAINDVLFQHDQELLGG